MTSAELFANIRKKKSFLCVGLDADFNRIPRVLLDKDYPLFEFNKRIVDATAEFAVAYKPNLAFYESLGAAGWMSLEMTINYIREKYENIFLIADAKRGDIGNTSGMYANAFFRNLDFDAITLSPYMGRDSIQPYLEFRNKWSIILGLTSNRGAEDFQQLNIGGKKLYEQVISISSKWGDSENMMYVVGATQSEQFKEIRKLIPNHFLLVPGVGTQGGSIEEVYKNGYNNQCGLLVNVSRSIIYADVTSNFEESVRQRAFEYCDQMKSLLENSGLI